MRQTEFSKVKKRLKHRYECLEMCNENCFIFSKTLDEIDADY